MVPDLFYSRHMVDICVKLLKIPWWKRQNGGVRFSLYIKETSRDDLCSCPVRTMIDRREFRKGNFSVNNHRLSKDSPASFLRVSSPWSAKPWRLRHPAPSNLVGNHVLVSVCSNIREKLVLRRRWCIGLKSRISVIICAVRNTYYWGDRADEEMGGACSADGRDGKYTQVVNLKRQLRKTSCRWDGNIKIVPMKIKCVWTRLNWMKIGTNAANCRTRLWFFEFR
jgi:hypothetical protein